MRKVFCLTALAVVIGTTVVWASGSSEKGGSTEPDVVHVLVGNWRGPVFEGTTTFQIAEERTGTKLQVETVGWSDMPTKLRTMLAGGDRSEIVAIEEEGDEINLVENGMLVALNTVFDTYPNIEPSRVPEVWDAVRWTDGNIYSIPIAVPSLTQVTTLYRKDWLDAFGQSVPTTIDEYIAHARAVANNDPNHSGRRDTYALGGWGDLDRVFDQVFGAYGVLPNVWTEKDGALLTAIYKSAITSSRVRAGSIVESDPYYASMHPEGASAGCLGA